MLAFESFEAVPARAEFPPDGAVADRNNPAIASGIYPTPTLDGIGLKYVFYFDCEVGMWIGVAVSGSGEAQLLNSTGPGHEFPSGPPSGSVRDAADRNHAVNKSTGENFVLRDGSWRNAKTGASVKSPKLCPTSASDAVNPRTKDVVDSALTAVEEPLFPDAYQSPLGEPANSSLQKPNKLPSPPVYVPDAGHGLRTLNPSQGPVRISVPLPSGKLDIVH